MSTWGRNETRRNCKIKYIYRSPVSWCFYRVNINQEQFIWQHVYKVSIQFLAFINLVCEVRSCHPCWLGLSTTWSALNRSSSWLRIDTLCRRTVVLLVPIIMYLWRLLSASKWVPLIMSSSCLTGNINVSILIPISNGSFTSFTS